MVFSSAATVCRYADTVGVVRCGRLHRYCDHSYHLSYIYSLATTNLPNCTSHSSRPSCPKPCNTFLHFLRRSVHPINLKYRSPGVVAWVAKEKSFQTSTWINGELFLLHDYLFNNSIRPIDDEELCLIHERGIVHLIDFSHGRAILIWIRTGRGRAEVQRILFMLSSTSRLPI